MKTESAPPAGPMLALDTSQSLGSVAVGEAGRVLAEVTLGVQARHSEALLPAVAFALERARLEPADLAGVVVGAGPGSFTGVRIAAAAAKGLVHALGLPLYAYSSLAGLAAIAGPGMPDRAVCAVFDARRQDVYAGCYRFPADGGLEVLLRPTALPAPALIDAVAGLSPLFVGDGAIRHQALFSAHGTIGHGPVCTPRASALLWLVEADPAAGIVRRPADWVPTYARPAGAMAPP